MDKKVYAVYDSKAEAYLDPFYMMTDGLAIRAFQSAANDAQHDFHRFAADYTLFRIGSYHPETGFFTQDEAHTNLGTALQYVGVVAGE